MVIHFRNLEGIDFPWLLAMLQGSFISHINTLVVPGGKMGLAMELIMLPLVQRLMEGKKNRITAVKCPMALRLSGLRDKNG
ncbi:phosphoribulokinase [Salmonella enterica subsp. enterica]|uniref:Phosphoribulokinase n=1 Tax=Salmonella enterica I TaxID=59201 RepID=A0A3S4HRG3_SALET|nr:phosphoribulokinase [Salmonella enterica subsp. enterica]VUC72907.1 phosphoribulokinase [Salmonella sp. NCTC 11881]